MQPKTINLELVPTHFKSPYRSKMKILGNNLRNLGKKQKMNIYQLFNDQFANQIQKGSSDNQSQVTPNKMKQTKNIFYLSFKEKQSLYVNKKYPRQQKLPSLSKNIKQIEQEGFKTYKNQLTLDEDKELEQKAYCRQDSLLEDLSNLEEHRKKLIILQETRYNPNKNHTRYYFNTKKELMINPQLGYMMLNNRYNRYEKSTNIHSNSTFNAELNGTQKAMFLSPQKIHKLHPKRLKKGYESELETSKSQKVQTSMTGLTLDHLRLRERQKQRKKQQLFSPWSINVDFQ